MERLYLGVDGGGTGCRARVEDAVGRVLGTGFAGPASTRQGIERSWAAIRTACEIAVSEAGLSEQAVARLVVGIGVAGFNRKGAREAFLGLPHPFASIAFATDGLAACLGAHGGHDGGVVIDGTGTSGVARVAGAE